MKRYTSNTYFKKLCCLFIVLIFVAFIPKIHAQEDNKWEVSLSTGLWIFTNDAKSTDEELFFLPNNMNPWQLSGAWPFNERFSLNASVGIQQTKDDSGTPNIFSIISGEEIEVEGRGGGFVPIDFGVKCYLLKIGLRPYIQLNGGYVFAKSQHTLVEGNINDGINRTDFIVRDKKWLGSIGSGFDYRAGT